MNKLRFSIIFQFLLDNCAHIGIINMSIGLPETLAHYYGWPSAVNGSGGVVATAAGVFSAYKIVVFGAGLEDPTHGDHANTVAIIADPQMAGTEVYGYIDATIDLDAIQDKIDSWSAMGVVGIFMDRFGYDFNVSRSKQRSILWCIHCKGLKAYVNAWNVDDVFDSTTDPTHNPNGLSTRMKADDMYLAESYQIVNGDYGDAVAWETKSEKMKLYKTTFPGVKMATISTWDSRPYEQGKWNYSYGSSAMHEFDYAGFGEEFFSASSASLPFRPRMVIQGTRMTGPIVKVNGEYERQRNIGIQIDTVNHTVSEVLAHV